MENTIKTGKIEELGEGSRFTYNGMKAVVLDARPFMSLCITLDPLFRCVFDSRGENDFAAADISEKLNGGLFTDPTALASIELDLTTDDGEEMYGHASEKVGLISTDMYRRFRKLIPNASESWWTLTPTTKRGNGPMAGCVKVITPGGAIRDEMADRPEAVRPIFCLKKGTEVSFLKEEITEREPSFGELIFRGLEDGLKSAPIPGISEMIAAMLDDEDGNATEEPAGQQAEAEDEARHRAQAVDMMKHISAAFKIEPEEINRKEARSDAKALFDRFSSLMAAGFTEEQALALIKR